MSAEDNLSTDQFRLYHGTSKFIHESKMIEPRLQGPDNREDLVGQNVAFATTDLDRTASLHKYVYEVHPNEHVEKLNDVGDFFSKKGFKIKRLVTEHSSAYNSPREKKA
jgi:glycine cleavage system regulatory protein